MVTTSGSGFDVSRANGAIPLGGSHLLPGADAALAALAEAAERGEAWDAAFEAYRARAAARPPISFLPPDGRVNLSWLTDLDGAGAALDLGSPFGEIASNLALDFESVAYVGADTLHGRVARLHLEAEGVRTLLSGSEEDASELSGARFDLALFVASAGWKERLPAGLRTPEALVARASAALRESGWLAALMPNPFGHPDLRRPSGRQVEAVRMHLGFKRALKRHRFADVREYLVGHDLDIPSVYVPATRRGVLQYQTTTHPRRGRRAVASAGLYATLFPARLILASR